MAKNIVEEVSKKGVSKIVDRLNNTENLLNETIARAELKKLPILVKLAGTGFFHRREAIKDLQQAISNMTTDDDDYGFLVQRVQEVIEVMQDVANISDEIIQLGTANIAQNRAVVNYLENLLNGNARNLSIETRQEISDIIKELNNRQDFLERQTEENKRETINPDIDTTLNSVTASFEPIDNSKVEIEDGNKLFIHTVSNDNQKLQVAFRQLQTSILYLEQDLKSLKEIDVENKAEFIINGVFKVGFDSDIFIRNLSFSRNDGSINRRLAIRCQRVPGDWLETELNLSIDKNLLFEGVIFGRGKEISVSQINIIAESSERLPFEVLCSVRICDNSLEIRNVFLDKIIDETTSVYEHTSEQLTLWEEYLNWSRKIAEHQIKGCKYVDINYDEERQKLIFTLVSESKEEFDKVRKSLRRDVLAFSNSYSTNEWKFIFDKENRKRNRGEQIGLCDRKTVDEFYLDGNEAKLFESKKYKLDDENLFLTLEDVKNNFQDKNPYIVKISYDLGSDDKDYIQEKNLEDKDLLDFVYREVIPRYPNNGFLALSAVGDFSLIWRFTNAIKQMKNGENFSPRLGEWLFDSKFARKSSESIENQITEWRNKSIESNQYQKEAVEKMLQAPDLFLLQGPPGTGKTTVIAEAIYQFVKQGKRVLLSSQSNDAVDNALERLANTPEIRALRIGGRRAIGKNADEELAKNKFSEETALRYYYKSISSQISERMLDKWNSFDSKANEYNIDKRDLRNFNQDISDLINKRGSILSEQTKFQSQLLEAKNELEKFNAKNLSLQNEGHQLNNFISVMNGNKELPFILSNEQISLIKDNIDRINNFAKSKGLNLSKDILVLENSQKESNTNLLLFLLNVNELENIKSKIIEISNNSNSDNDSQLLLLDRKITEIDEKLNDPNLSDFDYEKLESEISKLRKEKRNLAKEKNVSVQLNTTQFSILSENNKNLLQQNPMQLHSLISESLNQIKNELNGVVKSLQERNSQNNFQNDSSKIKSQIDSLEGRINSLSDDLMNLNETISQKRNTVVNLCKKYELPENSSADIIEEKINDLFRQNLSDMENAKHIRDSWGDVLSKFKKKLDEHSENDRLLQIDNDNYFKNIYVKACNVVGISCTANPKNLEEKDYSDFDVVIIDEVSKATPPELLIPLMKARKTVLVGDHRQLPPMFKENQNSYEEFVEEVQKSDDYDDDLKGIVTEANFSRFKNMVTASLFKEHFENADASLKSSLLIQFRMHSDIMNIINRFYEGRLECGIPKEKEELDNEKGGKAHNLRIPSLKGNNIDFIVPKKHAYWIDSSKLPSGQEVEETHKGTSTSSCNFLEEEMAIELVKKIARTYKEQGFPKEYIDKNGEKRKQQISIGIISFYQMQVNDIRRKIKALRKKEDLSAVEIDVNTVDRFQGKEKQIIIVSLVRNKKYDARRGLKVSEHVLSFERINVAFSRAQNLLLILGAKNFYKEINVKLPAMDSTGYKTVSVYQNIMQDLERKGCFFDSSTLIDNDTEKKIADEINKSKDDSSQNRNSNRNNKKGGRK